MRYEEIVAQRRRFSWPGYVSYAEVGLDGPWVTPYQIASAAPSGPVLLTFNFLDAPTARRHANELRQRGYLPDMVFNRVLDAALQAAGLARADLYVTHAFHLLPPRRSSAVAAAALEASFDSVARHELVGRDVIALGQVAAALCARHGIAALGVTHPSARGLSHARKAELLATALRAATCRCA